MSPLWARLLERFGGHWQAAWEGLLAITSQSGFAAMLEEVVEANWVGWSDFGRRRAGDILMALAALDARGGATAREAADWIGRLQVSQSPGVAAVQVMTIHKSKGLGFEVVILPEISNDKLPVTQRFDVAEGSNWLTETPPRWARDLILEMREAEARWAARQHYESFCMLYVALTRAKRGLYVLLEPPGRTNTPDRPSLCNWIARCVDSGGGPGVVWQSGNPGWTRSLEDMGKVISVNEGGSLQQPVPRRERTTPSGLKKSSAAAIPSSTAGMRFGSDVHAAFESIGWIDAVMPDFPRTEAGKLVGELLEVPELRRIFTRGGRAVEVLREQSIDAVAGGKWLSGVIDRLHLERGPDGGVARVEVIDFKTDRVSGMAELTARYAGQMAAYREVMELAYPAARVDCVLLSTHCRAAAAV